MSNEPKFTSNYAPGFKLNLMNRIYGRVPINAPSYEGLKAATDMLSLLPPATNPREIEERALFEKEARDLIISEYEQLVPRLEKEYKEDTKEALREYADKDSRRREKTKELVKSIQEFREFLKPLRNMEDALKSSASELL